MSTYVTENDADLHRLYQRWQALPDQWMSSSPPEVNEFTTAARDIATRWWERQQRAASEARLDQVLPKIRWRIVVTDHELQAGSAPPDGYGLAWRDWTTSTVVYMPVPLNAICGAVRMAWHRLRCGVGITPTDAALRKAHRAGFLAGERNGWQLGRVVGHRKGFKAGGDALLASMIADLNKGRAH